MQKRRRGEQQLARGEGVGDGVGSLRSPRSLQHDASVTTDSEINSYPVTVLDDEYVA